MPIGQCIVPLIGLYYYSGPQDVSASHTWPPNTVYTVLIYIYIYKIIYFLTLTKDTVSKELYHIQYTSMYRINKSYCMYSMYFVKKNWGLKEMLSKGTNYISIKFTLTDKGKIDNEHYGLT